MFADINIISVIINTYKIPLLLNTFLTFIQKSTNVQVILARMELHVAISSTFITAPVWLVMAGNIVKLVRSGGGVENKGRERER